MRLVMTCSACPEQYDVFHGKKKVGYLRLRHGHFTAEYLPEGTMDKYQEVYSACPDGDGQFEPYEREKYLKAAKDAIRKAMESEP